MFKLIRKLIGFGLLVFILLIGKNYIAKVAVQKGIESATGLPLQIGRFDLGLSETHIGIKNLTLHNPEGYSEKVMFEAPEIFVDYNLGAIFKKKIYLEEVRLDLGQLILVRNEKGELNINALRPEPAASQDKKDTGKKPEGKALDIQIDHLLLKIGKVVYKDFSGQDGPTVKVFPVNIYEKLDNISGTEELIAVILRNAVGKIALANLGNLDLDFLRDAAAQGAVESLRKQVDSFKDKIKLPFGGN